MAEIATIARPYAEALFQASRADLAATAQWVDALAAVAGTGSSTAGGWTTAGASANPMGGRNRSAPSGSAPSST